MTIVPLCHWCASSHIVNIVNTGGSQHSTGPHPGWRAPLLSLGAGAGLAPIPHRSHDFRIILCPSYISTETLLHTATSVPLHQPATCCFNIIECLHKNTTDSAIVRRSPCFHDIMEHGRIAGGCSAMYTTQQSAPLDQET